MQIGNCSLAEMSNESLVELLYSNENNQQALQQLIWNNRRTMIKLGNKYLSNIPIYDIDDYIQEGSILIWKLIHERKFRAGGSFFSLFYKCFENRCIGMYRNYVLHNLILVSEYEYGGEIHAILVEANYAKKYREKQREYCRAWYEKHRKKTDQEPRPKLTEEEKKERARQYAREYYRTHKEQCLEAKHRWYRENREYALKYQKEYDDKKFNRKPRLKQTKEEKKELARQRSRESYQKHREQRLEARRRYYREKKEYELAKQKEYRNRKKVKED